MKTTEMLNQIKTLLNISVKLEETKLENGTVVSAESFEKGSEIFIVTDDEKVAMPVGEYLLEDGRLVVVAEEGVIDDVRAVADEAPAETSDLEETIETEVPEEVATEIAAIIEAVVEVIAPVIEEVKKEVEELKKKFSKFETEEEEVKEEEKEELSKVSSKPIKHNPEAKSTQRKQVEFGKGQFTSTLDRVLNKLNK
jgi:Mg2+ and Co2+ transporter CorA